MNTVVGLACAVGVNKRFNAKHHGGEQAIKTPIHVHADGKKHEHKKSPEKSGCCNDKVVKFQNIEKKINHKIVIDAPVFVAIANTLPADNLFSLTRSFPDKKIIRFFHPPPHNILIEIQRFQI